MIAVSTVSLCQWQLEVNNRLQVVYNKVVCVTVTPSCSYHLKYKSRLSLIP